VRTYSREYARRLWPALLESALSKRVSFLEVSRPAFWISKDRVLPQRFSLCDATEIQAASHGLVNEHIVGCRQTYHATELLNGRKMQCLYFSVCVKPTARRHHCGAKAEAWTIRICNL
jgi:hypothetical protein